MGIEDITAGECYGRNCIAEDGNVELDEEALKLVMSECFTQSGCRNANETSRTVRTKLAKDLISKNIEDIRSYYGDESAGVHY